MGNILSLIFGFFRLVFGSAGQAEGKLKQENKQKNEENKIISKQRDSNINNVVDAKRMFGKLRGDRKK